MLEPCENKENGVNNHFHCKAIEMRKQARQQKKKKKERTNHK